MGAQTGSSFSAQRFHAVWALNTETRAWGMLYHNFNENRVCGDMIRMRAITKTCKTIAEPRALQM